MIHKWIHGQKGFVKSWNQKYRITFLKFTWSHPGKSDCFPRNPGLSFEEQHRDWQQLRKYCTILKNIAHNYIRLHLSGANMEIAGLEQFDSQIACNIKSLPSNSFTNFDVPIFFNDTVSFVVSKARNALCKSKKWLNLFKLNWNLYLLTENPRPDFCIFCEFFAQANTFLQFSKEFVHFCSILAM